MKEIALSSGEMALVDDQDYDFLSRFNWQNTDGYASTRRSFTLAPKVYVVKRFFMHRLILDPPPGIEPDHIDRNRLNNQRSNLRLVTRVENMMNKSPYSNNTSGYRGVRLENGHWRADIRHYGQRIFLGYFPTAEDAARAWNSKALELRGENAWINPVLDTSS